MIALNHVEVALHSFGLILGDEVAALFDDGAGFL